MVFEGWNGGEPAASDGPPSSRESRAHLGLPPYKAKHWEMALADPSHEDVLRYGEPMGLQDEVAAMCDSLASSWSKVAQLQREGEECRNRMVMAR